MNNSPFRGRDVWGNYQIGKGVLNREKDEFNLKTSMPSKDSLLTMRTYSLHIPEQRYSASRYTFSSFKQAFFTSATALFRFDVDNKAVKGKFLVGKGVIKNFLTGEVLLVVTRVDVNTHLYKVFVQKKLFKNMKLFSYFYRKFIYEFIDYIVDVEIEDDIQDRVFPRVYLTDTLRKNKLALSKFIHGKLNRDGI